MNKFTFKLIFKFIKYSLLLLVITTLTPLQSQIEINTKDLGINLTTEVNKTNITIGEKIKFTVLLTQTSTNEEIYPLPLLTDNIGEFSIKNYEIIDHKKNDNKKTHKIIYWITAYNIGMLTIPAIQFNFQEKSIKSDPIKIKVISLINTNQGEAKLEDVFLNPTITGKINNIIIIIVIMITVVFIIMLTLIYFRVRRKKNPIPFYILTLMQIRKLEKQILENKRSIKNKQFYYQFYDIIKFYLSEKEGNKLILSLTTNQFEKFYINKNFEDFEFYLELFSYADRVKFTDFKPKKSKTIAYLNQIKTNVTACQKKIELLNKKNN